MSQPAALFYAIVEERGRHIAEGEAQLDVTEQGLHVSVIGQRVLILKKPAAASQIFSDAGENAAYRIIVNQSQR